MFILTYAYVWAVVTKKKKDYVSIIQKKKIIKKILAQSFFSFLFNPFPL
jgi:hypothetical protein